MPVTYSVTNVQDSVNTTATENQFNSDVIRLSDGRWLMVWQTNDAHPTGDLYGRIYDNDWSNPTAEFRINADHDETVFQFAEPRAVALADGEFAVVWHDNSGLAYRAFEPDGTPKTEADIDLGGVQGMPEGPDWQLGVAATGDGGFVVTFLRPVLEDGLFPLGDKVYARFVGGTLNGHEVEVSSSFAAARATQVIKVAEGYLVSWTDRDSYDAEDASAGTPMYQMVRSDGIITGNNQPASETWVGGSVDKQGAESHGAGEIAALSDGGYVITWIQEDGDGHRDIYLRRFSNSHEASDQILVADDIGTPAVELVTGLQGGPFVAGMIDGGWVVVWTKGEAENSQVVGQRYSADGLADGPQMIFSARPDGVNIAAGIEADSDGGFTVLFERKDPDGLNGFDVYAVTAEVVPDVVLSAQPTVDLDPTEEGTGATANTNEDDPAIFIAENVVVADTDDENIESATVTITNAQQHDELRIDQNDPLLAGLTVTYNGPTSLSIFGPASAATYASVIELVTFYTESGDSERAISVTVNDGDSDSDPAYSLIDVTGVDDAPVNVVPAAKQIVATGAELAFSENNENLISTGDEESEDLTVTLSVASGTLTIGMPARFMVTFTPGKLSGGATVEFTGSADNVNNALAALVYKGNADFAGEDTLTIVTSDGEGPTDTDTVTIEVGEGAEIVRIYNGDGSPNTFTAGDDGDWTIYGNGGSDQLYGAGGNDFIDGGEGGDSLWGGEGNDIFIVNTGDDEAAEEEGHGDADELRSSVFQWTLSDNIEKLVLLDGALNGTGNALANEITGNAEANSLDGRAGVDKMIGGDGNDTYAVDDEADEAIEKDGEGYDTVNASVSYSLAFSWLEKLVLSGTGHIDGEGNGLDNLLVGNSGDNLLDGSKGHDRLEGNGGDDIMKGGEGNDTFIVTEKEDKVRERANEGNDTVESSVSFSLAGQHIETLWLIGPNALNGTGNGLANFLYGNASANTLRGGAGDDHLDGISGSDRLFGEAGSDVYLINDIGAKAYESVKDDEGGRFDAVRSSVSYSLAGQHIEILYLTGSSDLNGVGNSLANEMWGNDGANRLRGDGGGDLLAGGGGNDILHGGAGNDEFRFDTPLGDGNVDQILDFKSADDTIRLGEPFGVFGPLGEERFFEGTQAADDNDRIVYNKATGELFFDVDGSGAEAQVLFATLAAGTSLSHADFLGMDLGLGA